MSFSQAPWVARFGAMGDEAEKVFEQVWPTNWVRFGLNRPPLYVASLPPFVRYTPDYLTSDCFVEVQGCGTDQLLKLKLEKYAALMAWNVHMPVKLFVWDGSQRRWSATPMLHVAHALGDGRMKRFPEGKPFFAVPLRVLDTEWVVVEDGSRNTS